MIARTLPTPSSKTLDEQQTTHQVGYESLHSFTSLPLLYHCVQRQFGQFDLVIAKLGVPNGRWCGGPAKKTTSLSVACRGSSPAGGSGIRNRTRVLSKISLFSMPLVSDAALLEG
jgi:hypothetical protein